MKTPGYPHLEVSIILQRSGNPGEYIFAVFVELLQIVIVAQNPNINNIMAPTWSTSYSVGLVEEGEWSKIRNVMRDEVLRFVQAFKAVNAAEVPAAQVPVVQ